MPNDLRKLNDMAEEATARYLERSSIGFLECAVNLMLHHMSRERVIDLLKAQIRIIRDFD